MAYMQRTRILMDNDLDDNATLRERLDLSGKITCIEMRINCDRYDDRAAGTTVYTLADVISRIELLRDATTPLVSLTGTQLDAMNYWELGRPNARRYRQAGDTGNDLVLYLMGGRGFYDREYGWDFDVLDKVYLEYTYNLHEDTAEYFAADDHDIKLYAWQWKGDNLPAFRGYFRQKQLDAWTTTAANAEHKIEIPAANPVRRVAVQSKTRGTTLGGAFSQLDLRVDKGAYSPVVIRSAMDWVMAEVAEYGLDNEIGGVDFGNDVTQYDFPYWFSYGQDIQVSNHGDHVNVPKVVSVLSAPLRFNLAAGETAELTFVLRGWGFQKCLRIGFDHEYDGFDLLRVPGGKALDLVVTETAADKAVASFFQDVVSY